MEGTVLRGSNASTRSWPPLVAIEGPSGCGKSTVLPFVVERLRRNGLPAEAVSNNDSSRWSPIIRDLANQNQLPLTLAYATAAARAELREAYPSDALLVSDRFVLSSYVYQGYAGVPSEILTALNGPLLKRTMSVLLELSESELEARRSARAITRTDWFKRALTTKAEINLYTEAASTLDAQGHKVVRINAQASAEVVATDLVSLILRARSAL